MRDKIYILKGDVGMFKAVITTTLNAGFLWTRAVAGVLNITGLLQF